MKSFVQLFACFYLAVTVCSHASGGDVMEITNNAGMTLTAYIVSVSSSELTFKKGGVSGRQHKVQLSALSEATREKLKEWQENGGGLSNDFEITFKSGKASALSSRENYDDRTLKLSPEVTVANGDSKAATGKQKVSLVLIGKSVVDRSAYYVFLNETKDLHSIGANDDLTLKFSNVRIDYDDRGYGKYGSRYHGYAVIVHDGNGGLSAIKTVPSTLEKHGLKLLKLRKNSFFDRDLNRTSVRN